MQRLKRFRCEECGKPIDAERVANALAHGVQPRYCTNLCSGRARARRHYAKKKRTG